MTATVVIALWALACVGAFALGLRFYRTAEPKGEITLDQAKRFGRLLMMAAAAMLLFLVAALVHGDLKLGQSA